MTYNEAIREIEDIPKFTTKNPLEETRGFYNFIKENEGFSEEELGKIIHVAGTNGKGSVCAFLNSICLEAGYKTGMFISPHLITTRERFIINNEMISEETFLRGYEELKKQVERYHNINPEYLPTYFETLFFIMILLFRKEKLDYLILETGLGGRLDTTNIFKKPALTVITEIGLDHMAYLGDTVEAIAGEKAGIIKQGVPLVFTDKTSTATKVIEDRAKQLEVSYEKISKNDYKIYGIKKNFIDFSVCNRYYEYDKLILNINALYQVENASLAIAGAELLQDEKITKKVISSGIEKMKWPGRMEEILPNVYVDGAHNEDGIEAFIETLKEVWKDEECTIVFSAVSDKNYESMIRKICELEFVKNVVVTHIQNSRGVASKELTSIFKEFTNKNTYTCEEIEEAISCALRIKGEKGVVFFVGSLYLVGMIKECVSNNQTNL